METTATYALGVELRLVTTANGGRKTPLAGGLEGRFQYRPNWGLPGMVPPDQTGAAVFGFSRENIAPGEMARAVIVPPFPGMLPEWARVEPGTELPMYEGARVCGYGRCGAWTPRCRYPARTRQRSLNGS